MKKNITLVKCRYCLDEPPAYESDIGYKCEAILNHIKQKTVELNYFLEHVAKTHFRVETVITGHPDISKKGRKKKIRKIDE